MNLFDILSAGKKDLNEENVSSFLAWILDPKQSHGCGALFLKKLINTVDKDKFQQWLLKIDNISVDVLVEEEVVADSKKRRFVDIVIVMSNSKESSDTKDFNEEVETESMIFAIENKIREGSSDKFQLKEEYEGLKNSYPDSNISFLYLTPRKTAKFNEAFSCLPDDLIKSHLTWTSLGDDNSNSLNIISMFRDIIQEDLNAKITPLSNELKFVLKSFIVFAENGFRSTTNKKSAAVRRSGNKYFKGTVSGVEGVEELMQQVKSEELDKVYIGFLGGMKALEEQNIDDLENRPYKWDDNLSNKNISNWIPIGQFIEAVNKLY